MHNSQFTSDKRQWRMKRDRKSHDVNRHKYVTALTHGCGGFRFISENTDFIYEKDVQIRHL